MKRLKGILILLLMALAAAPAIAKAKADDVYIDIDMDGNAYVSIDNDNGDLSIWYNGRDILAEWKEAQERVWEMKQVITFLAAKAKYADDLGEQIDALNQTLNSLIFELNGILSDLYAGLSTSFSIMGVNHNSSDVVVLLRSGNETIASLIDDLQARVDAAEGRLTAVEQKLAEIDATLNLIQQAEANQDDEIRELQGKIRLLNDSLAWTNKRIAEIQHGYEKQLGQLTQNSLYLTGVFTGFSVIVIIALAITLQSIKRHG